MHLLALLLEALMQKHATMADDRFAICNMVDQATPVLVRKGQTHYNLVCHTPHTTLHLRRISNWLL